VLIEGEPATLDWLERSLLPANMPKAPVLLGLLDGAPHFAVDVCLLPTLPSAGIGSRWGEARALATDYR
jgi:hypothetical protein